MSAVNNATWTLLSPDGSVAVEFTSMLGVELKDQSRVLSAPTEEGSFVSYNKVDSPLEGTVTLASDADFPGQQGILASLAALKKGTGLISIVTPSREYRNLTLESYNTRRTAEDGATLLVVELSLTEVRFVTAQTVKLPASQCKNPTSASTVNTGKTQPVSLSNKIFGEVKIR